MKAFDPVKKFQKCFNMSLMVLVESSKCGPVYTWHTFGDSPDPT